MSVEGQSYLKDKYINIYTYFYFIFFTYNLYTDTYNSIFMLDVQKYFSI